MIVAKCAFFVFTFIFFLPFLQARADFFSDSALMHIVQDVQLTKSTETTYKNMIFLPNQQFCEIKVNQAGMAKDKLMLAYGYDNLTAKELKFYKPRVLSNSYIVKSRNFIRKPELTTASVTWNDSEQAQYCRQLELSVFDKNKQAKSRMPASVSTVSAAAIASAAIVTESVKNSFYSSCIQNYNALNFNFVTDTKFIVNVSCNLLTDDKKQVIGLLKPYFLILDK